MRETKAAWRGCTTGHGSPASVLVEEASSGCGVSAAMPVSLRALRQLAVFWGVMSTGGGSLMYYLLQKRFQGSEFYQQSVRALEEHTESMTALGAPPLRTHLLHLRDTTNNHVDALSAKLAIPVSGQHARGFLRSSSSRTEPKERWEMQEVVLCLGNGSCISILRKAEGSEE
ncbi:cytochrome c oxidase assembly factor 1 homolog isoform X1 [Petromyzon marinus]|uniref:Cytochrome c oxidase assembly factor 1 homolog isoform X1 n=2 Tax=Petromyzon marinus TaxID=7757 RepID=A0AAJ7SPG7_PETMA|nr:cytochrome c oxidase assembly factor 1 homolog isoform X1 [Petromyzon marinus]